jgi:uncharacterized protein
MINPGQLVQRIVDAKFPAERGMGLILAFAGGSHQYGASTPESDLDIHGIFIEAPFWSLGIDKYEHFTYSTSGNQQRNTADDEDFKLYSLRYWAYLAAKGNPTILSYMFAQGDILDPVVDTSIWTNHILPYRSEFLARTHATAFIGYGRGQLHRMQNEKGRGKHGQRPELEVQFGYDTKAAMHMVRMGHECLELLTEGRMTFPRPEKEILLDIRLGKWSKTKVEQYYLNLEEQIKEAEQRTDVLPARVDRRRISKIVANAYLEHWKSTHALP